jgi:FkbM family methyltransferase
MNRLFRNLRKGLRRLFDVKTITLNGIIISADRETIGRTVRNGLFKETYEQPERELVSAALRHGDRVLEIGGGIGVVSLLCARICGPANVLTYEANPAMAKIIHQNYALNNLTPNLRSRAITSKGGDITFFVNANIISSSLHQRRDGHAQTVPADALDEVIAEWKPTVIVMDIEGAETTILPHSELNGVLTIILELHPGITGEPAITTLKTHLQKIGFQQERAISNSALFTRVAH